MAQIDDLNTAVAGLQTATDSLNVANQGITTAANDLAGRLADQPACPDLQPNIDAINGRTAFINGVAANLANVTTQLNGLAP